MTKLDKFIKDSRKGIKIANKKLKLTNYNNHEKNLKYVPVSIWDNPLNIFILIILIIIGLLFLFILTAIILNPTKVDKLNFFCQENDYYGIYIKYPNNNHLLSFNNNKDYFCIMNKDDSYNSKDSKHIKILSNKFQIEKFKQLNPNVFVISQNELEMMKIDFENI